jgi:hypothetical protein
MGFRSSSSRFVAREILLLGIAVAAAFVFINHDNLYLTHAFRLADVRIESYTLATAMIYLFLRLVIVALELRPTRAHAHVVRCPECGEWLDDPTTAGLEAHRRIELTPKPSPKEIVSAVALRRAVDMARFGSMTDPAETKTPRPLGMPIPENLTGKDLLDALHDPDFIERMHHSPQRPLERELKR